MIPKRACAHTLAAGGPGAALSAVRRAGERGGRGGPGGVGPERYRYDVQGNVEYLDANINRKSVQTTDFAWQNLYGGMRMDAETGLYFAGRYYHTGLGRFLPSGAVSPGGLNAASCGRN